jgi:choline dehydrogenase-like flavoprotein
MLHDVETPGGRAAFAKAFDVCVIGAGPAGISLARRLGRHGLEVALMEAGGLELSEQSQAVAAGESVGLAFPALDVARLRYLGGSSGHWNGLCRALDAEDFEARPQNPDGGWPIGRADLDPYTAEVHEILDLVPIDDGAEAAGADAPGFRRIHYFRSAPTRFGEKYLEELTAAPGIALGLHANLVDLRLNDALDAVTEARFKGYAAGDAGFAVTARAYCLCCGGIENARLLLNFTGQVPEGIGNRHDLVGRYFNDHPGTPPPLGEVILARTPPTAEPQFFAPSEELVAELGTLPQMIRINHQPRKPLPLGKELARSVQCAVPYADALAEAVLGDRLQCDTGGLEDWWRSRDSDRHPWGRVVHNSQAALNPDSRVTLSDERDAFGMRRARLDWRTLPIDDHTIRENTLAFAAWLADSGLGRMRIYDWVLSDAPIATASAIGPSMSSYHHMCTTRMSADPAKGVVDADCRVHGIANLYVGGSSVFASTGFENPTYTIVQLALRLGDHLAAAVPAPATPAEAPAPANP